MTDEETESHEAEGKHFKNVFKRFLYQALSELTEKTLPWGNLTGIRPTKIAMELLERGKTDREIVDFMEKEHFVSEKKAKLSLEIAKREKEILQTLHYENGYSLYIGIPFCPKTTVSLKSMRTASTRTFTVLGNKDLRPVIYFSF